MPISLAELRTAIQNAGFPPEKRSQGEVIVWTAIEQAREYRTQGYYDHTGKLAKKPTAAHRAARGRPPEDQIRTILISAMCRAWILAFDSKPTLNSKRGPPSTFESFAIDVLPREGFGKIHEHLEEYWSQRKAAWT
jgi:hypothetical protein